MKCVDPAGSAWQGSDSSRPQSQQRDITRLSKAGGDRMIGSITRSDRGSDHPNPALTKRNLERDRMIGDFSPARSRITHAYEDMRDFIRSSDLRYK